MLQRAFALFVAGAAGVAGVVGFMMLAAAVGVLGSSCWGSTGGGGVHAPGHAQGHAHQGGAHRFENASEWSKVFDAAERDAWQKPDVVIAALGLGPGDVVADVGAGTGYFTVRVARALLQGHDAGKGKVLAVDVEPDMVKFLAERAQKESLPNVVAVLGAPDDPRLPEQASVALVVDTAHHIENRAQYFAKLRAQMPPGGRVVVVEFHAERDIPVGPPPAMRIAHKTVTQEMQQAGFQLVAVDEDALPYQYIATYRAP